MFFFIVALIIAFVAIIFALQNAAPILVSFLIWSFEGSLALILIITFILGFTASLLLFIFSFAKKKEHRNKGNLKVVQGSEGTQNQNEETENRG